MDRQQLQCGLPHGEPSSPQDSKDESGAQWSVEERGREYIRFTNGTYYIPDPPDAFQVEWRKIKEAPPKPLRSQEDQDLMDDLLGSDFEDFD